MTRRSWTLRRTLVISVAALLAAGLIVSGFATSLALRSFVYERLDAQVLESLNFISGPGGAGDLYDRRGPSGGSDGSDASGGSDGTGPGQRVGSLQVILDADGAVIASAYIASDGTKIALSDAAGRERWMRPVSFRGRPPPLISAETWGRSGSRRNPPAARR